MRFVPYAIPEAALARRLDALRFTFRKWDLHVRGRGTVAPGALVLTAEEHSEVVRASEALDAAATRAQARFARDAAASARELGVPDALARLATAPPPGAQAPRVARVDLFPTRDGWRASEINDDAPGGMNDAIGLAALFHDAVEKDLHVPGDLPDALVAALRPESGGRVGLVYATAYAEDLQVVRLVADLLEAQGVPTTLASPAHFECDAGEARLVGERVEAVYRFFPAEWFPLLPNLAHWEAALAAGLRVVNPFLAAWTQSKAFFAWLHAHAEGADRDAADALVPPTTMLSPESRALAERERERLVLKPAFGRMGEGVVLGATVSAARWRKALDAAKHRRRPHVLQERFHVTPVEVAPGATRTPCVGAYVVDGRFAGYYSRLSESPVVAYDAANVLTVVEGL